MKPVRAIVARCALAVCLSSLFSAAAPGQDFYPLKVGNSWSYRCVNAFGGVDTAICSTVTVTGDSLFANGHRYFVLSGDDLYGSRFVRKDSNAIHYISPVSGFDQEALRLDGRIGDTVLVDWTPIMSVVLIAIDTVTVFGSPRVVWTYKLDGLTIAFVKLCGDLGPMTEWRYTDTGPPWPESGRELAGCRIDGVEYGVTLGVDAPGMPPPSFALRQNYPNPFNPSTTVTFTIAREGPVHLGIYDLLGRRVAEIVDDVLPPGVYARTWVAGGIPSGVYFYRLRTATFVATKSMTILR
jgi:hypothetical protein